MSAMNPENVQKVVEVLNKARSMELHSIQQYMNQHYNLDNLDYGKFAASIKRIAIDEMTHAENFAERINRTGRRTYQRTGRQSGKRAGTEGHLSLQHRSLQGTVLDVYNQFARVCRDNNDNVSAKLFEDTLADEQKHYDYFTNTDKHLSELGYRFSGQNRRHQRQHRRVGNGIRACDGRKRLSPPAVVLQSSLIRV